MSNDTRVPSRVFPRAKQDADAARQSISTPQTESPAYKLAFQEMDFLVREDLRPVRFQLELLKTQLILEEAHIGSTFVFYGSARIPEPAKAQALLDMATDDKSRRMMVQQHATYHAYCDVPADVRDGLLNAPSIGRFYRTRIEAARDHGQYGCRT